jgi:hypothetical protein
MTTYNCTPHSVEVFAPSSFVGLEQKNPTTFLAKETVGEAIASFPPEGQPIRIATQTIDSSESIEEGIPLVETSYGELSGIPEGATEEDWFIVSLPAQSMARAANHRLAHRMIAPYKVVRSTDNGSLVLGCMGFTK